ncbi:hypothetical protein [Allosphingosinicella deserti]|uniref:hypothetical protein n=1 Tax=Allosphingosinicella deserti TaxID=2116704 RepID=UPI0018ED0C80|nr:hypothetical protein [Sphingomonas deserti]
MRTLLQVAVALVLASVAASPGGAKGFADKDLARLETAASRALGEGFSGQARDGRLILTCSACSGEPIVSIEFGRQTDGTEQRVRAGTTTVADLEKLCRLRSEECRISALEVAPAVGWVSRWTIGSSAAATAILIRDGDLLTIRSVAADGETARRQIDALLPVVRTSIVGR